jgi:hypothetical protein
MKKAIIALALLLAGCAAVAPPEAKVEIKTANIAVGLHCKPKVGPDPAYPDTAATLAAVPHPDAVARLQMKDNARDVTALVDELDNLGYQIKLLLEGRNARIQRDGEKTAALKGCE